MSYANKPDANAADVVEHLRRVGASVQKLTPAGNNDQGMPDLLVGWLGVNHLLEVKNPRGKNEVGPKQEEWHRRWKGKPVTVVRSPVEALRAIGAL